MQLWGSACRILRITYFTYENVALQLDVTSIKDDTTYGAAKLWRRQGEGIAAF